MKINLILADAEVPDVKLYLKKVAEVVVLKATKGDTEKDLLRFFNDGTILRVTSAGGVGFETNSDGKIIIDKE